MTALYCDPRALAGILRERQDSYEFAARGSVGYYEGVLAFGAWVAGKRSVCAHGVWIKALREAGWSYSVCNRAIKLHGLGVSAAELARDGAKAVLKRFARPRRPAGAGESKFSAGAKFAEPPETPLGGGEADPDPAEFSAGAKFEPPPTVPESAEASAPPDEFEELVPEDENTGEGDAGALLWPWPLDMKYSGDRMVRCLIAPEIELPQAREPLALLAYWNFFDRDGKQRPASIHNDRLAKLLKVDVRTIQGWLDDCRRAGWLHSAPQRGALPDRQYVWPNTPPGMRQRSMPLPRTFERTYRASALEAGESAAARPDGGPGFTPGVTLASSRDEPGFTPGVTQVSPLNGKETGIKTGRRGTRAGRETPQPDSPHPPEAVRAFGIWNGIAAETGMRPAVELDADRAAKLEARVRDAGGMDEFRAVCERAGGSKALTGRKPGSWPADLDQFLEPRFFRRVREGGWDDAPGELERTREARRNADPDPEALRAEVLKSPLAGDAPGFVAALCKRIGVGGVRSWLKDCRLESRGKTDAALLFANGFAADRVDRDYGDAIRDLWRELHGGELVLETRRAA